MYILKRFLIYIYEFRTKKVRYENIHFSATRTTGPIIVIGRRDTGKNFSKRFTILSSRYSN